MASVNEINQTLKTINDELRASYPSFSQSSIPAAYIRQNLTYVGLKEGYRFGDAILTLTQDVNPDFEDPVDRTDKTTIKNLSKSALVFGTSQALHDRPIKDEMQNGAIQNNADYDYEEIEIDELKSHEFSLNPTGTGYNPSFNTSDTSESITDHLSYLCGVKDLTGDYPYRYITSGSPLSIYNLANALEGREGPFTEFSEEAREKLSSQEYDPIDGIEFETKELFAESISVIYGTSLFL